MSQLFSGKDTDQEAEKVDDEIFYRTSYCDLKLPDEGTYRNPQGE